MFLKKNENVELKMRCRIAEIDTTNKFPGDDIVEKSIITTVEKDKDGSAVILKNMTSI
ncbi:hypothetical protein [Fodinibius sp. AD559]|uniref:hypothetical protein n=1 Tax=Fodinibius sp. AD559 TaxID=3424179 RepID=UPI004046F690